jgi:hypothetical protein
MSSLPVKNALLQAAFEVTFFAAWILSVGK